MTTYGTGAYGSPGGTYGVLYAPGPGPGPGPSPTPGAVLEPPIPAPVPWGAWTRSYARSRLRIRLNEFTPAAWSDDTLNDFLDEAVREVARATMHLEDTVEFPAVANTQSYIPAELSGAFHVDRVEYIPDGQPLKYPLEYRDFRSLEGVWWTAQSQTIAIPEFFTLWGAPPSMKLVVYPTPAIDGKFRVFFWRVPHTMTTDNDLLEVPAGWEDLVIDYGEYLGLRRDRDPRWQEVKAKFDERIQYMIRYTSRHTPHAGYVDDIGGYGQLDWLYGGW